jgi:hypothetical protein
MEKDEDGWMEEGERREEEIEWSIRASSRGAEQSWWLERAITREWHMLDK